MDYSSHKTTRNSRIITKVKVEGRTTSILIMLALLMCFLLLASSLSLLLQPSTGNITKNLIPAASALVLNEATVDAGYNIGPSDIVGSPKCGKYGGMFISYYDAINGDLRVAYSNALGPIKWISEVVDRGRFVPSSGETNVGSFNSIALAPDCSVHISYYDSTNEDLKYACKPYGSNYWAVQTPDSAGDVGMYSSIAVDFNNVPHISYFNNDGINDMNLKYAMLSQAGCGLSMDWRTVILDVGRVGITTSIALDSKNSPHISYYDITNGDLKYARKVGDSWERQIVDSNGNVGRYSSIAVGPNDFPHISYYDSTNKDLKYATWFIPRQRDVGPLGEGGFTDIIPRQRDVGPLGEGGLREAPNRPTERWGIDTVDPYDNDLFPPIYSSIAVDSHNVPHISYSLNNYDMKYAKKQIVSRSWVRVAVDSPAIASSIMVFPSDPILPEVAEGIHLTSIWGYGDNNALKWYLVG